MAKSDKELLKQFALIIVPELKKVSKRFAGSIEYKVDNNSLEITASPYINTLIDGRKPTGSGAVKGSPTLQQSIRAWIDERGITPKPVNGKIPTLDQLSWAISKSIHRNGDLLYQRGGGNKIFDVIITEKRLDSLLNILGNKYFNEINSINLPKT